MAIPFVVDEDRENGEVLLQQLLGELCQTLREIRVVQRSNTSQIYNARPRLTNCHPTVEVFTNLFDSEHRFSDFGVNVSLSLPPHGLQNDSEPLTTQNASGEHSRRGQSRAEPFCFDENPQVKVAVSVAVTNKEWPKQEPPAQTTPPRTASGAQTLLSKLVPVPLGGPIWTAVLCVVGWHLFRAR